MPKQPEAENEEDILLEGDYGLLRGIPRRRRLGNVVLTAPERDLSSSEHDRMVKVLLGILVTGSFFGGAALRYKHS